MSELKKYPITDIAKSRVGHQYSDSVKFFEFISLTLQPVVELQDLMFKLLDIDLDTAKGIKLDLLGRIVGAPAVIPNVVPKPFFGFDDQEESLGFGEIDEPEEGGFLREIGQLSNTDYVLDNDEYHKAVKAQILKNNSDCTPDQIIEIVSILIDDLVFKYYELEMAVVIAPQRALSRQERRLIEDFTPIPMGVSLAVLDGKYDSPVFTDGDLMEIYEDEY